jgi:hypothetical protein
VTAERLQRLAVYEDEMSYANARSFINRFIGALAVNVSDEVWDKAIETAENGLVSYDQAHDLVNP